MRKLSEEPPPRGGGQVSPKKGQNPLGFFFANFSPGELDILEIILRCSPQREALDLLQLHAQLALRLAVTA